MKIRFSNIALILVLFVPILTKATTPKETAITNQWFFHKGELEGTPANLSGNNEWTPVNLPHTWNAEDVMDDRDGYYRGPGWYRKNLHLRPKHKEKSLFLHFQGANQIAELYINGKRVGKHIGGYSEFRFRIDPYVNIDPEQEKTNNQIMVRVDNSHNQDIPPLSADFTFYGGIYREVSLIETERIHFQLTDHASSGIYITTPKVTDNQADVKIRGSLVKDNPGNTEVIVVNTIVDAEGKPVSSQRSNHELEQGEKVDFTHRIKNVKDIHLWSPENPYLYQVRSRIYERQTNKLLDETLNPLGFRYYSFDPARGFFLNGSPYQLNGMCRHQDYEGLGNALPDELHEADIRKIKEMGANFLRIAHYQQDRRVLELCDKLGIITSVETPIINRITQSEAFFHNSQEMLMDMMKQNFNHPSLVMWTYMNEVLLDPRYENDPKKQKVYFQSIEELARKLEDTIRQVDPHRYTMIANHAAMDLYRKVGLTDIPMLVGWNLYHGWYGAGLGGFGGFLDRHRQKIPDKPLLVSEYGAGADPRLRSFSPERFDFTVEYAVKYHEAYLNAMEERPFVAASMVWNFADFNSESRKDAVPHINNKGLLSWDRTPKDPYYLYPAYFKDEPVINIASKNWKVRSGTEDNPGEGTCRQPVQIFTNLEEVSLRINGNKLGTRKVTPQHPHIIRWEKVPFKNGKNTIEAVGQKNGKTIRDCMDVDFVMQPAHLKDQDIPFEQINISLGDERMMVEQDGKTVWLPDQPYEEGSWGYIGGEKFVMKESNRHPYGSNKSIHNTSHDPIYQTQRVGLDQFKFDVPDGYYEIIFHFAELLSGGERKDLVYNLYKTTVKEEAGERKFDVILNNTLFLKGLSNNSRLIPKQPYSTSTRVVVENGEGLTIDFSPTKGEAVLNAIQLKRIY